MKPTAGSCALGVCLALACLPAAPALAQQPPPTKLEIVIVEGQGAINKVKEQNNREPVVQVLDENNKPVAGASVVFFLPNQGPGGAFFDGTRSLTVTSDAQGRAVARGIRFNQIAGEMLIRVTASYGGETATATITQTNMAGTPGPGLSKTAKILIIVAIAAGATAGAIVATRGGSSSSPAATPPITITAGTPTVGAP